MNAITSTGTSQGQDKRAEFEAWHAKNFKHMQPWPEFARSESFPEEYLDLYMQKRWEGWQARARSSPPESTRTANSHPEDFCQQCGGPNFVWFAANDVWNKVIPERVGVLCPRCFAERAKRVGFGVAWELVPQREPAAGIKSEEGPPDGASASGQAACGSASQEIHSTQQEEVWYGSKPSALSATDPDLPNGKEAAVVALAPLEGLAQSASAQDAEKLFDEFLLKHGWARHQSKPWDVDWYIQFAREYASSSNAALHNELDKECASHLETIDDRDSMEDALQKAHIALGGDGEWTCKFPPAHYPPGCTGDLRLDVPYIAAQIFEEAKEAQARAEAAEAKLSALEGQLREAHKDVDFQDSVVGRLEAKVAELQKDLTDVSYYLEKSRVSLREEVRNATELRAERDRFEQLHVQNGVAALEMDGRLKKAEAERDRLQEALRMSQQECKRL